MIMRDERDRILRHYQPLIERYNEESLRAGEASQNAWEVDNVDAAHVADREYCRAARLRYAHILQMSIELGSTTAGPSDEADLALVNKRPQ